MIRPADRTVTTRNFRVNGRRTSLALEAPLLDALQDIARRMGKTLGLLLSDIERANEDTGSTLNLSSATRVYIAEYYRKLAQSTEAELATLKRAPRRVLNTSSMHFARRDRCIRQKVADRIASR